MNIILLDRTRLLTGVATAQGIITAANRSISVLGPRTCRAGDTLALAASIQTSVALGGPEVFTRYVKLTEVEPREAVAACLRPTSSPRGGTTATTRPQHHALEAN